MGSLTLVGLGPGDPGELTVRARDLLLASPRLIVSTFDHPVVRWLETLGREMTLLASVLGHRGLKSWDLPSELVPEPARPPETTVLATPGHPLLDHLAIQSIASEAEARGIGVTIVPGVSFLDASLQACSWSLPSTLQVLSQEVIWEESAGDQAPSALPADDPYRGVYRVVDPSRATFVGPLFRIVQLQRIAPVLAEHYGVDHSLTAIAFDRHSGAPRAIRVSLANLEWDSTWSSLCLLVEPIERLADLSSFDTLRSIVARLRAPSGCPWDREQDYGSMKKHLIEETYEAITALEEKDFPRFAEELGDVLLQVVMYAQFGREGRDFALEDVLRSVNEKLIRRHPHVFADVAVSNSAEVLRNWEAIKRTEKNGRESIFGGIPESAPALMRADAIQSRATRLGWVDRSECTLPSDLDGDDPERRAADLGTLLFHVVSLARRYGIDPEAALRHATNRFRDSFEPKPLES